MLLSGSFYDLDSMIHLSSCLNLAEYPSSSSSSSFISETPTTLFMAPPNRSRPRRPKRRRNKRKTRSPVRKFAIAARNHQNKSETVARAEIVLQKMEKLVSDAKLCRKAMGVVLTEAPPPPPPETLDVIEDQLAWADDQAVKWESSVEIWLSKLDVLKDLRDQCLVVKEETKGRLDRLSTILIADYYEARALHDAPLTSESI